MTLVNAFGAIALDATVQAVITRLNNALPLPTGAATETSVAALLTNTQLRAQALQVEMNDNYQGVASIGATNRWSLQYAAVLSGGTGHAVGDIITTTGGTPATAARVKVLTVAAGVITAVKVVEIGRYSASQATLTQGSTTGAGTGATFTTTFANNVLAMIDTTNFNSWVGQLLTSSGTILMESSVDGSIWSGFSWYFTNFGTLNESISATGSASAGSLLLASISTPWLRVVCGGNATMAHSLRMQPFTPTLVKQGTSPSSNNFWYSRVQATVFGAAGNVGSGGGHAPLTVAATTNATLISTFLTTVYGVHVHNATSSWIWVKIFNKGSTPVVGTDVPRLNIGVAPHTTRDITYESTGISIRNAVDGMGFAVTAGGALLDATPLPAGAVGNVGGYIVYN